MRTTSRSSRRSSTKRPPPPVRICRAAALERSPLDCPDRHCPKNAVNGSIRRRFPEVENGCLSALSDYLTATRARVEQHPDAVLRPQPGLPATLLGAVRYT